MLGGGSEGSEGSGGSVWSRRAHPIALTFPSVLGALRTPHSAPRTSSTMPRPRYLILADNDFGPMTSKTANSVIRYRGDGVVGVLDRAQVGATAESVLGFGGDIPVVGSIEDGLALRPDAILIGIAPVGGRLPEEWRDWVVRAIASGCDVWSGLHTFLADDPVLRAAAAEHGRTIHDVRRPPADLEVASGAARDLEPFVVQAVGTDCNVGKMTAQLQLTEGLNRRGVRTRFAPTGQTGIFIEGWGIAVDAVVADFVAGAAERVTLEGARNADIVMVEGQGSVNHPGYSGVTLGLLHGSWPMSISSASKAVAAFSRITPACTRPTMSSLLTLITLFIRCKLRTMHSSTDVAPPMTPVPLPYGTTGIRLRLA